MKTLEHASCCGCDTCIQQPIWPTIGNSALYLHQNLFNRDDHNHSEVLGEHIYGLPFKVPENQGRSFQFINQTSGQRQVAPYSTDNAMHTDWVPYRLENNLNTPIGSDSAIYFENTITPTGNEFYEGNPLSQGYTKWKDWLDIDSQSLSNHPTKTMDEKVALSCQNPEDLVCTQTCVDWWTNRPVPPQGALKNSGMAISGGCPFNTVRALACYPCGVHKTYIQATTK